MGQEEISIPDENHELFIICCGDMDMGPDSVGRKTESSEAVLLALANVVSGKGPNVVTFHKCFILYDIQFYSMDHLEVKISIDYMVSNALHSLHWVLNSLHSVPLESYASRPSDDWIFPCVFPSNVATTRCLFPLLIHLTESQIRSGVSPGLIQSISAVAKSICSDYDPIIHGSYFHLTIKNTKMLSTLYSMWRSMKSRGLDSRQESSGRDKRLWRELEVGFTYLLGQDEGKWTRVPFKLIEGDHGFELFSNGNIFPVTVRFSLQNLVSGMQQTTLHTAMHYAREFCVLLNEDLDTFLERSPRFKDRFVFCEGWGRSLVEELRLVWKLQRIIIM
jgi:hypothetical protein